MGGRGGAAAGGVTSGLDGPGCLSYRSGLAWEELGARRGAMHQDGRALWERRREHGRLGACGERCRVASNVIEGSSAWGRAFSRDAREEHDRARRDLEYHGRELGRAGVDGPRELARRGEELSRREEAQRAREGEWAPYERAWAEIGGVLEARREAGRRAERERGWERRDRERGDPPGTARARDEADRDDWCP